MEENVDEKRQLWLTRVEPYEGESISHFLGRFRREKGNKFSAPSGLGEVAGLGAVLARWEKFYFNPFPARQELEALAAVVEVDADRLREMLPPPGVGMKHSPIRLCCRCYAESPCHQIEWQFKVTVGCDRHKLRKYQNALFVKSLFLYLLYGWKGIVRDVLYLLRKWRNIKSIIKACLKNSDRRSLL